MAAVDPAAHRITLAAPHVYSLMQGNPSPRRYRALNVLEELDQPGEFVINAAAGVVFFWPPDDGAAPVTISTLDAPIVALKDASHIVLRGFVVECGLGDGIEVSGGTNCVDPGVHRPQSAPDGHSRGRRLRSPRLRL